MSAPQDGVDLVRVVLADDQELVRSGLQRILHPRDGVQVVAACSDGDEVADAVREHRPDVVVMDLRMRRVDGIEATRTLRRDPDAPPVLVLTTFDDDELLRGALHAGAAGFVLKDTPAEDLIRAVHVVAAGEAWLDPAVTARVMAGYHRPAPSRPTVDLDVLTPRELEVFLAIGRGLTNSEIADTFCISELTVKSHVGHVFSKLELRDRPAAIVLAHESGLLGR